MTSLKFYNEGTRSEKDVWQRLDMSGKFAWSWCKDTQQPLRHVAIVLYFDGVPRFTINFRTVDGASKFAAAFGEAERLITIEVAPTTGYEYFDALEEFEVMTASGNQRAKNRIVSLTSYNPGNYNLFANNCRDHVKGVVKRILGKTMSDSDFEKAMDDVVYEDTIWKVGVTAAGLVGFGMIAAGVVSLFGDSRDSEDRKKHNA